MWLKSVHDFDPIKWLDFVFNVTIGKFGMPFKISHFLQYLISCSELAFFSSTYILLENKPRTLVSSDTHHKCLSIMVDADADISLSWYVLMFFHNIKSLSTASTHTEAWSQTGTYIVDVNVRYFSSLRKGCSSLQFIGKPSWEGLRSSIQEGRLRNRSNQIVCSYASSYSKYAQGLLRRASDMACFQ